MKKKYNELLEQLLRANVYIFKLQQRIDKAINYIKDKSGHYDVKENNVIYTVRRYYSLLLDDDEIWELLELLGDKENEN